ncbi:MAG: hypothetical protein WC810_14630 [Janthinobacterium sp.]|jgi:hypothetical protein
MNWDEIVSQNNTNTVTKRYKVTKAQDDMLLEIERELNIPPSAIVRLALNTFLPKIKDSNFKYEGVKILWDENKF